MRLPILALLLFAAAMALTDVSIYKQLRKLGHRWLTTAHIAVSAIIYIVLAVIAAFAKSQADEEFFIMMMWGLFSAISVSAAKLIYMPFYAISMLPRLRESRALKAQPRRALRLFRALQQEFPDKCLVCRRDARKREQLRGEIGSGMRPFGHDCLDGAGLVEVEQVAHAEHAGRHHPRAR